MAAAYVLTNTGNRAYKSRERCASYTLPGQEMSTREWMCLESTLMNEDFVPNRENGSSFGGWSSWNSCSKAQEK